MHAGTVTRIDITAFLTHHLDPNGGAVRLAGIAAGPGTGTLDTVTEGSRTYLVYDYTGPRLASGATAIDTFTEAARATATATVELTVTGLAAKRIGGTDMSDALKGGSVSSKRVDAKV